MKWQLLWQRLQKWLKRFTVVFGFFYVLGVIDMSLQRPPQCPVEKHTFQGQAFDVEICLGHASESDHLSFWVYSPTGEVLAWRSGTFAKEGHLNYMAIEDTVIRYSDDTSDLTSASIPEDCVLNMPPTWVDWLEARLPGGIPGVNHCGTVSDEISEKARHSWFLREETERIQRGERPVWPDHPEVKQIRENWAAQQRGASQGEK